MGLIDIFSKKFGKDCKVNYKEVSIEFVTKAFELLDERKNVRISSQTSTTIEIILSTGYTLTLNSNGNFRLLDPNDILISHSSNEAYSKITYIGKILAIYLEHLQVNE